MPVPSDVSSVHANFVNHYGKFIPQLYNLRAPLERLLQKNVPFVWSDKCQESFQRIKRILMTLLSPPHFQPDESLLLASDASSVGVGAVLFHRFANRTEKVIANASKSLTPAERNYSQIEREALSIVFGVKKFHQYLWGRDFTLLTDHQPLTTIFGFKKGVPLLAASQLQRWALFLINYTIRIQYCSTKQFGYVDAFSRLPRGFDDIFDKPQIPEEHQVNELYAESFQSLPISLADVTNATSEDKKLELVKKYIKRGQIN